MSRQLPLLCENVSVYRGPYIPVLGLRGQIRAEGLGPEDRLELVGVMPDKRVELLGELTDEAIAVIFNPERFEFVRAIRCTTSGKPISVWAE